MRIIKLIVVGLLVASVGAVSQPAPLPSDLDLTVSVEVRPDKDGEWQAVEHTGDVAETEFGTVSQTHHQRGPETGTTWQIDNPTENPIQWRVRVSIPLTDLPRTKGQARVMYGRADQILDLDLAADTLPVPLGNGITPNINQTLWSVAFAKGKKTLRVDLDRRGGGWQMDRDGDDLQFTYQTHVWPPGPSAAAMHVTTRPVQTSPERLDLIDWLDGPHSVTARMSHRGVYFPDEPIELHLRGVSLEPNVLP
ncbi:MAG TPA: hypothetical protein QGH10_03010, partial [Armatimonadota bacterium]|nr:hypothetical protein [Armatimonadota bacterium]